MKSIYIFNSSHQQELFENNALNAYFKEVPKFSTSAFNNYCGYWHDGKFKTFFRKHGRRKTKNVDNKGKRNGLVKPFETLTIYGDSLAHYFFSSLKENHTLCLKWFNKCTLSRIWVYKLVNETRDRYEGVHKYDGLDFNETRFINLIRDDFLTNDLRSNRSVYVFNFGCHTVMTLRMQQLQRLLANVLEMIASLRHSHGKQSFRWLYGSQLLHLHLKISIQLLQLNLDS